MVASLGMAAQTVSFKDSTASALLDLIRGLAAIAVCLEHWRNILFVDYAQIHSHRLAFAIPYVLTSGGHQAVVIFFVLSGFLIGGTVRRSISEDRWTWRQYLTHRMVRLWLVLIPALLLGMLLDVSGIHLNFAPALYQGHVHNSVVEDVTRRLTAKTLLGNVVFLQTILVRTFGSNGPLWSLANEFWYYLMFPAAMLLFRRSCPAGMRVVNGVMLLAIGVLVGKSILLSFPIWLMGALLARLRKPSSFSTIAGFGAAILYVPLFFFLAKSHIPLLFSDYLLGSATLVLLWILLANRAPAGRSSWIQLARGTARCSYTLYLVHLPFIVFVASLTVRDVRWQPTFLHILYGAAILAGTGLYAWLVAAATEFRTDRVRAWVESRIIPGGMQEAALSKQAKVRAG